MSYFAWVPPPDDVDWVPPPSALQRYDPDMVTKKKSSEFGSKWRQVDYYCSVCQNRFGSTYEGMNPFKPWIVDHFDIYHSGAETKSANKH